MKTVVIVGRPNTGKSTLFNGITNSRDSLVHDKPGVTRDVISNCIPNKPWTVFDTAGLETAKQGIAYNSTNRTIQTIKDADVILFVVDGKTGLNNMDLEWARLVKRISKSPVLLLINKTESSKRLSDISEFYKLGFGQPILISAEHKQGFDKIYDFLDSHSYNEPIVQDTDKSIKIAILGQPNVGKSTFVNKVLGKDQQIVMDIPGVTRDTVKITTHFYGRDVILMDTAGLRRKSNVKDDIETLSALKSLDAIDKADIVILIADATKNIENQTLTIASKIYNAGKVLCIALNKWDLISSLERNEKLLKLKHQFINSFHQIQKPLILPISSKQGTGIQNLFKRVYEQWDLSNTNIPTSLINRILEKLISDKQPPMSKLKRPMKIKFANQSGHHPTRITINVGGASDIPESYTRYLHHGLSTALKMEHLPLIIDYKKSDNPFK